VRGAGEEQEAMCRRYPWKHRSSCDQRNRTSNTKIVLKITTQFFKDWTGKQMDGQMDEWIWIRNVLMDG
jgi:hypothetical protein